MPQPVNPRIQGGGPAQCPTPESLHVCDTLIRRWSNWRLHVATAAHHNPEWRVFVILMLNTGAGSKAFICFDGTLDTILVHPREVFGGHHRRASAVVLLHNHPSGDATPSEATSK